MKILAVDPGYDRLGIAVIDKNGTTKETLLYSDCYTTNPKDTFYTRLHQVSLEVARIIEKYSPDVFAMETLFFTKNQKTALHVAETRGAILYQALNNNLTVYEYTPIAVKIAVTGYGKSDKKQILSMVDKLISINKKIKYDDEYDAIAIGLTCAAIHGRAK